MCADGESTIQKENGSHHWVRQAALHPDESTFPASISAHHPPLNPILTTAARQAALGTRWPRNSEYEVCRNWAEDYDDPPG